MPPTALAIVADGFLEFGNSFRLKKVSAIGSEIRNY